MGGGKKKREEKAKKDLKRENARLGFGVGGIQFETALMAETDRGCALVAAEFLSDGLEYVLRSQFKLTNAPESMHEQLVGTFTAPLGTMAMRSLACRAFGLIDQEAYDAIDAIREIRNECGHRKGAIDLKDPELDKYVRWLAEFNVRNQTFGSDGVTGSVGWPWWDYFGTKQPEFSQERTTFMDAAFTVHVHLQTQITVLENRLRFLPRTASVGPKESRPSSGPQ